MLSRLPDIPSSTTWAVRWSLWSSLQRQKLFQASPSHEQARHRPPPKQVRHPTDCRFVSGCSPPRLACAWTTQLPSTTELRHPPARTCTVPTWQLHGRTHAGEGRHPRLAFMQQTKTSMPGIHRHHGAGTGEESIIRAARISLRPGFVHRPVAVVLGRAVRDSASRRCSSLTRVGTLLPHDSAVRSRPLL
jgi:hypothetical protein